MKKPAETVAAETAAQLVHDTAKVNEERTVKIIEDFFSEGEKRKRYIDTNRIPFICEDIKQIHKKIDTLTRLIYIGVGIISTISILFKWVIK